MIQLNTLKLATQKIGLFKNELKFKFYSGISFLNKFLFLVLLELQC